MYSSEMYKEIFELNDLIFMICNKINRCTDAYTKKLLIKQREIWKEKIRVIKEEAIVCKKKNKLCKLKINVKSK